MDGWDSYMYFLKPFLSLISPNSRISDRDVKNIVQEELRKSTSQVQTEFLQLFIRLLDEKKRSEQEQEEQNLKTKVEEMCKKFEKFDREKKVSDNREWMMNMLGKITAAQTGGHSNFRGRGGGGGPGRGSWNNRKHSDPKTANDHLPWCDGPKGERSTFQRTPTEESFVRVDSRELASKFRGHGGMHRGHAGMHRGQGGMYRGHGGMNRGHGSFHHGRGYFHQGHPTQQEQGEEEEEFTSKQHPGQGHKNYHPRGNYQGHGRGAIPKTTNSQPSGNKSGKSEMTDLEKLNAKLQQLSASDVQISLSPDEIIAIKQALKEQKGLEENQKAKSKEPPHQKKNKNKKNKNKNPSESTETQPEDIQKKPVQQKEEKEKEEEEVKNLPPAGRKKTSNAAEKPSTQEQKSRSSALPAQIPLQLYPVSGFDDSILQILPGSQVLEAAMLLAKDGDNFITHQPRTIQELKDFKTKYPTAELFSLKPPSS